MANKRHIPDFPLFLFLLPLFFFTYLSLSVASLVVGSGFYFHLILFCLLVEISKIGTQPKPNVIQYQAYNDENILTISVGNSPIMLTKCSGLIEHKYTSESCYKWKQKKNTKWKIRKDSKKKKFNSIKTLGNL